MISGSREDGQASLRILEAANEFQELRDDWSAWSDSPETDLDFFSIHLRHRCGVVQPHVMVVYRSGRPDCMLIGWLYQGSVAFNVGYFTLFQPDARILHFVERGFLGNQSLGNSQFLVREIIRSLHEHNAQAVVFSQLNVESPLYDSVKREPNVFCRERFTPVQNHRFLTLPYSFDDFLRALSRKSRHEFRRHVRMLERDFPGKVRFQFAGSERDVESFVRRADEISQRTYQRALGTGFVNNLEPRETLRVAAQKGALRACLLHIDERPAAFFCGILYKRTLYGSFMGYDPEFKKYWPGLQALMRVIEDSFEPSGDLLRVDLGGGNWPYKRALCNSSWTEGPVWIFAPTVKGMSLHILKVVPTLLHSVAVGLLAKSYCLRRVKKMLYRRALRRYQRKMFRTTRGPSIASQGSERGQPVREKAHTATGPAFCQNETVPFGSGHVPTFLSRVRRAWQSMRIGRRRTTIKKLAKYAWGELRPRFCILKLSGESTHLSPQSVLSLEPGELVEVKSEREIQETLDSRGTLGGLGFLPTMKHFCGKRFVVLKKVERVYLEETRRTRRLKDTVLLDRVMCDGQDMGCDRSCFFFWREAWLRRVNRE